MINHYLGAALARERHGILLAEAEAARQARPARPRRPRAHAAVAPRPRLYQTPRWLRHARSQLPGLRARSAPAGTPIVLRDGSHVLIRQVQSVDAPLLADGFARLSAASRWMRFLTPKKELSPAELSYFTDLDHHDHEALGALDNGDGRGVGIARFIRHADDPYAADLAVTIADDWQGRGLGSELLARLSDRARQEGWTCSRPSCTRADGPPASPCRPGGWRPFRCKTRMTARSGATSSPRPVEPLVTGGSGSAGPSGSAPSMRPLRRPR
jgi:GNAT superfamily N-acetyltransferase